MAQKSSKDLVDRRGTIKPAPPIKETNNPRSIKGIATPTRHG